MSSLILPVQHRSFHIPTPRILTSKDSLADPKIEDEDPTPEINIKQEQNDLSGTSDTFQKFSVPNERSCDVAPDTSSKLNLFQSAGNLKIKTNIILTPSPSSIQNKRAAEETFAVPTPVTRHKDADEPKKPAIKHAISSGYPDLEYEGKIYKFFDWEIVAKLCWVAPFTQPPEGLFYHTEDDYFLHFSNSKARSNQSTKPSNPINKPPPKIFSSVNKEIQQQYEDKAKEESTTFPQENSINEIEVEPPVLSDEQVSQILKNLQHSVVHRPMNEYTGSVVIKPPQGMFDSLNSQLNDRANSQQIDCSNGESLSLCRSKFTKNLPKKIGDQFTDYLIEHFHVNMSKIFKDRMSWKVLNSYLEGEKFLEEKKLGTRTLIKAFIDFIMTYSMKQIDESRTRDCVSKACYKLTILNLKVAFEKLAACIDVSKIKTLSIARSWPKLDIHYTLIKSQENQ